MRNALYERTRAQQNRNCVAPTCQLGEEEADTRPSSFRCYERISTGRSKTEKLMRRDFLRKYVSRRLRALSESEIAALTTAVRQLVVGSQGGAEALAIFHQLIYDGWASGSLVTLLARIKVGEKNRFAMIGWGAVRKAASCLLLKHAAVAGWTPSSVSCGTGRSSTVACRSWRGARRC